jgi:hypothetical protein
VILRWRDGYNRLIGGASFSIPVQEYRRTLYRPDCEYVDGLVLERNAGEKDHAKLRETLLLYLHVLYLHGDRAEWDGFVIQETAHSGFAHLLPCA